jgi:hypothetical protein
MTMTTTTTTVTAKAVRAMGDDRVTRQRDEKAGDS